MMTILAAHVSHPRRDVAGYGAKPVIVKPIVAQRAHQRKLIFAT
jgi:hypothetical protein